jgi:putative toxin-antitoxin system antitoxin component (TIGR02293 family)
MSKKDKSYRNLEEDKSLQVEEAISAYNSYSTPAILIARKGVSFKFLLDISEKLSLSLAELSQILHVSLRTLQRYMPSKKLDTDSSSKALQLAFLLQTGIKVFGSSHSMNVWMNSSLPSLGGQRPKDFLDTPFGFQLLEEELNRIEFGLFA